MMNVYCIAWQIPQQRKNRTIKIEHKEYVYNYTRDGALASFRQAHAEELNNMQKIRCERIRVRNQFGKIIG